MGQATARKARILIVDDHKAVRRGLINLLNVCGYVVVEAAANGEEALEWLTRKRFDLVITDTNMPDMSGIELTAKIRSNPANKKLIIIGTSTEEDPEITEAYENAGAQTFVLKSNVQNLLGTIENLLNQSIGKPSLSPALT